MSPWPGTPKAQQTPAINQPSMRFPSNLSDKSSIGDVVSTLRTLFNKTVDYDQAFAALPSEIASQASTAATQAVTEIVSQQTVTGVTSFNAQTGAIIYFPNLGFVNDQRGNPLYLTQTSDAGQKIVMGDSSPSVVNLNPSMTPPWFAFIGNDSGATVAIQTDSSAVINGLNAVYPGGTAIVFYDGSTFWCEGVAIATDSSLGVVRPDSVTIVVDSGGVISTIGATGIISLGPFLDSSMTAVYVQNGLITGWLHTP